MTTSKDNIENRRRDFEISVQFAKSLEDLVKLKPSEIAKELNCSKQYYSLIRTGGQIISIAFLKRCKRTFPDVEIMALCQKTAGQLLAS